MKDGFLVAKRLIDSDSRERPALLKVLFKFSVYWVGVADKDAKVNLAEREAG
jgi:hypothetical protein